MHGRAMSETKPRLQRMFARSEVSLLLVLVALIAVVSLISPRFFSAENFLSILLSYSYTSIFAIGFLFVLISGGIDISFTAIATVAQYLMALVLSRNPQVPILIAICLPIVVGVSLGCLNALLIHYLNAPPIIITIATLNVYYGMLQFVSGGIWIYNFPEWFDRFPRILVISFLDARGVKYGLSILTVIWLGLAFLSAVILRNAKEGRRLYALGGNLEAARRAGIRIVNTRLFAYGFLGFIGRTRGALAHVHHSDFCPRHPCRSRV